MDIQIENGFPVNPIHVSDGIVLINIFTLDPDKTEQFVATQVGEYKRLKGQFSDSYTANLHVSLDRTRAANYAHFTSVLVSEGARVKPPHSWLCTTFFHSFTKSI